MDATGIRRRTANTAFFVVRDLLQGEFLSAKCRIRMLAVDARPSGDRFRGARSRSISGLRAVGASSRRPRISKVQTGAEGHK